MCALENEIPKPYVFYPLSYLGDLYGVFDEPLGKDILEETLLVLKAFQKDLFTVFRPHNTTDINILKKILARINFTKYTISYRHPSLLIEKSLFVMSNCFTTVLADACYQNRYTIDYYKYDDELLKLFNGGSEGGSTVSRYIHANPKELHKTISKILLKERYETNSSEKEFPETPESFWKFWDKEFHTKIKRN